MNNNNTFLNETKKVNTLIPVSQNSLIIAQKFVEARRAAAKKELKSDDNTLRVNFFNNLINMLKSADITLNETSDIFTLNDNKVSGKNKTDLKNQECCYAIDKILLTGRYEKNDKPLFLKGIKYYHVEKKAFYEFQNLDQFKSIEKDFKKWSKQYIKLQGFIFDLESKKVYKDQK